MLMLLLAQIHRTRVAQRVPQQLPRRSWSVIGVLFL